MLVAVRLPETGSNETKSILVNILVSGLVKDVFNGKELIGYRIGITRDIDGAEGLDHLANFVDIGVDSLTASDMHFLNKVAGKASYAYHNLRGAFISDLERVNETTVVQGTSNAIVKALSNFTMRLAGKGELIEDYPTCDLNMLIGLSYSMILYRTIYKVSEIRGYSPLVEGFLKEYAPTDFFLTYFNKLDVDNPDTSKLGIGLLNGEAFVLHSQFLNKEGTRLSVKGKAGSLSFTSNKNILHTPKSIVQSSYAVGTEIAETVITYLLKQRKGAGKYTSLLRASLGLLQSYKFSD